MDATTPLPATSAVIEAGMASGLHIGAQLYASVHGRPVADVAFGLARPGVPGAAMTPGTVMLWLSCSKPVTAVAVAQQWETGRVSLDDRVAAHLPEFGVNGKEGVTVRHVLTHTAGFRWVETGWPHAPWEETIARVCGAPQERDWVAGRKAGYSPYASWFLLGEIVRRIDGREFGRYVREEIFEPLGMTDSWLTLPPERYGGYGDRIGVMQKTDKPDRGPADAGLDTARAAAACRPAGGCRGPMRELGRFYEMLLAGGTLGAGADPLAADGRSDDGPPPGRHARRHVQPCDGLGPGVPGQFLRSTAPTPPPTATAPTPPRAPTATGGASRPPPSPTRSAAWPSPSSSTACPARRPTSAASAPC